MQLEFGGAPPAKTTKIAVEGKKDLAPSFEEELWVPVWVPCPSKRATLSIIHSDFWSETLVAKAQFDYNAVDKIENESDAVSYNMFTGRKYIGPTLKWIHLYGANPRVKRSPNGTLMNKLPSTGSAYRGRLLVSCRVIKNQVRV